MLNAHGGRFGGTGPAGRRAAAAYAINQDQFGGCFGLGSSHAIQADGSRTTHGIAFDLNVAENPIGSRPNLDPGLFQVIEKWGFTWSGRWLVPDGMHFDWKRFN